MTQVRDALYASKIVSYTQGFDLMRTMGARQGWALDLGGIASIWRGGCIIRARFLNRITEAYRADPGLANLMLAPFFRDALNAAQAAWREVVANAVRHGIAVPAMSASLAYYDAVPQCTPAGQPAAGAARLLRRPYLRACRSAAGPGLSHRLARSHRLTGPRLRRA